MTKFEASFLPAFRFQLIDSAEIRRRNLRYWKLETEPCLSLIFDQSYRSQMHQLWEINICLNKRRGLNIMDYRKESGPWDGPGETAHFRKQVCVMFGEVAYHAKGSGRKTARPRNFTGQDARPNLLHLIVADVLAFFKETRYPVLTYGLL